MSGPIIPAHFESRPRFLLRFLSHVPRSSVLHGHSWLNSYPDLLLLRAYAWVIRAKGLCWIESVHNGSLPERYPTWPRRDREVYVRLMGHADRLLAASEILRDFLVDIGIDDRRVVTVGPLLPASLAAQDRPPEGRLTRFFETHDPVILSAGAMVPLYDYLTIGRSFLRSRVTYPNAGLVLSSASFTSDEAYRSEVQRLLAACADDVIYLEDVEHDELLGLMRAATVVVRGPARESYGLSRVEALLQGTPVVGTRTGEQHFVIPYDHGDVDSLDRAINVAQSPRSDDLTEARAYFTDLAARNLSSILTAYGACRG
jgi:glycosyltransferase involved in cell wall biosynthesis